MRVAAVVQDLMQEGQDLGVQFGGALGYEHGPDKEEALGSEAAPTEAPTPSSE